MEIVIKFVETWRKSPNDALLATCIDSEPLHFASKSVEIFHASLCHWSLENKLASDLSRIWKSLAVDTSCCNFFAHC